MYGSDILDFSCCADLIRDIKDPEHPHTLEELNVVSEDCISVEYKTSAGDEVSAAASTASDHREEQGRM